MNEIESYNDRVFEEIKHVQENGVGIGLRAIYKGY